MFSWYTSDFYSLELAYLVLDKVEKSLHSFFFSLVVSIDLSHNELRIGMDV